MGGGANFNGTKRFPSYSSIFMFGVVPKKTLKPHNVIRFPEKNAQRYVEKLLLFEDNLLCVHGGGAKNATLGTKTYSIRSFLSLCGR
jgi:hypothetical protein